MNNAYAYLPQDRLHSLAAGDSLAEESIGAVLFADISGFTPLADALARQHGSRRGADELTRRLNEVYSALIGEVERFGGSVIGFAGDAITCWFGADSQESEVQSPHSAFRIPHSPALRAVAAALAMQRTMQPIAKVSINTKNSVQLAIKTAVASGAVRRFVVGDPNIQLIDVLAGTTLDRMAAAEHLANESELVVDQATATILGKQVTIAEWRTDPLSQQSFAVIVNLQCEVTDSPLRLDALLAEESVRPWVLPALYERLQAQSGRFLAELRPATSLFLRFGGIDFDHDREAGNKLDQFIRHVQQVITRHEAALIQLTTGDKGSYLYVAFGAPIAHDDDSRRAIVAALQLRNVAQQFPFLSSIQIGISQGSMRVGPYGSSTRQTYGVLGEEVNLAARLMSNAGLGQILVAKVVYESVKDDFIFEDPQQIRVKGRVDEQTIYAVSGRQARISSHWQRLYDEPLAARELELAQMQRSLTQMLTGSGRILRIEGSAGVGKSHLVATFLKSLEGKAINSAAAICQSTERDTAYHAVRQITRSLFAIEPQMNEAAVIARVEESVRNTNEGLLLRLPLLGEIIGVTLPDNPTTASLDPKLRQEALQSLAVELVQSGARRVPLVILAEDVHWMDEASQSLLLALGRVIESAPILLVAVHRPGDGEMGRWGGEGVGSGFLESLRQLAQQDVIKLEELPPSGTIQLVTQRLRGAVSPLALSLIQAQAQGNPFFTEELVDALCESDRLIDANGVWTLSEPTIGVLQAANCLIRDGEEWQLHPDAQLSSVDLGIPNSIQGVILSRLDRLPESVKPTLKVASVIGRLFEFDLLAKAHPLASAMLGNDIATMLDRDFARIERHEPAAYIFKHNITQEVAYSTLLENQRRELHQSVALAIEELQPDAIERLAFHFYNGDLNQSAVRDKAIHYLDRAAQRAQHDYANETALSYLNRALQLEQRRQWLKAKVAVLDILGRREQQEEALRHLTVLAGKDDFETLLLWGRYYESVSDYAQAKSVVERALVKAVLRGESESKAGSLNQLGMIAWRQGEYEEAGEAYVAALSEVAVVGLSGSEVEAEAHYGLGLVYRQQGKYEEAKLEFEQDLALNRARSNRVQEARALNALGILSSLQRNEKQAVLFVQDSLDIRRAVGDRAGIARGTAALAQSLLGIGDLAKVEPLLREAVKLCQAVADRWHEASVWNELGIFYWMLGNYRQAETCLHHSCKLCRDYHNDYVHPYALLNLGLVQRELGRLSQSEEILNNGLTLATAQGEADLIAAYYTDLAILFLQKKQFSTAAGYAAQALDQHRILNSQVESASDLSILAKASVALGEQANALKYVKEALLLLNESSNDGLSFPQRDYWLCYEVYKKLGQNKAITNPILKLAYQRLMERAERISDSGMRQSYLENIAYHRQIIKEATKYKLH